MVPGDKYIVTLSTAKQNYDMIYLGFVSGLSVSSVLPSSVVSGAAVGCGASASSFLLSSAGDAVTSGVVSEAGASVTAGKRNN